MKPSEMLAGPELDRLIAEKVMGWTATKAPSVHIGEWFWGTPADGFLREDAHGDCEQWSPSTNIAHAWEVVEYLRNHGVALQINPDGPDPRSDWDVYRLAYIGEKLLASAPTAPLAICRAALQAVEPKDKE